MRGGVFFIRLGAFAAPDWASDYYTIGFGLGATLDHMRFRLDYSPVPLGTSSDRDIKRVHKGSVLVSWTP